MILSGHPVPLVGFPSPLAGRPPLAPPAMARSQAAAPGASSARHRRSVV